MFDKTIENAISNEGFQSSIRELLKDDHEICDLISHLSPDQADNIDFFALNPNGLTWAAFKGLDENSRADIARLIGEFKRTSDRGELKKIGKEIAVRLEN